MRPQPRLWLTLLAIVAVLGVVGALVLSRPADRVPAGLVEAAAGVGDPYLPNDGGAGYDAIHYDVQVTWDAKEKTLRGTATLTLKATQAFDIFHVDLRLAARTATVNGVAAQLSQADDDIRILVPRTDPNEVAVARGADLSVEITYEGAPGDVHQLRRSPAFYRAGDEIMIAGEPNSAPWWFPSNDTPRDPATYRLTVDVPKGTEAISVGRLIEHRAKAGAPDRERWVWQTEEPTVTYATFLAIGQFEVSQGETDGRPYVYAVSKRLPESKQREAMNWLRETPAGIKKLEQFLGPYPVNVMGGIVPSVDLFWGGLECLGRPVYNQVMVGSPMLLQHELAHMWTGDMVTLSEWNDIYNNEALASYGEWLTNPESTPQAEFAHNYSSPEGNFWAPSLSDPGEDAMFERVYDRGPASVHALRTRMGDAAFLPFLKSWSQQRGPRTLEEFRRQADDATPEDLTGFFAAWLDGTDKPAATKENGIP